MIKTGSSQSYPQRVCTTDFIRSQSLNFDNNFITYLITAKSADAPLVSKLTRTGVLNRAREQHKSAKK
jgi:hypothetical protein